MAPVDIFTEDHPLHKPWPGLAPFLLLVSLTLAACQANTLSNTILPLPALNNRAGLVDDGSPTAAAVIGSPPAQARFMGVSFGYDPAVLGESLAVELQPARPMSTVTPGWPQNIQFELRTAQRAIPSQLNVYPLSTYRRFGPDVALAIDNLQAKLDGRDLNADNTLPMFPLSQAVTPQDTKLEIVEFSGGHGLIFFTRVDHDFNPGTADIEMLSFQGITRDGQYLVSARTPLPESLSGSHMQALSSKRALNDDRGRRVESIESDLIRLALVQLVNSLKIAPDPRFNAAALPELAQYDGTLLAFDADVVDEIHHTKQLPVVADDDQAPRYLAGAPDMSLLEIRLHEGEEPANLTILPVRDDDGAFYAALPESWRQKVVALEMVKPDHSGDLLTFQAGQGLRRIHLLDASDARGSVGVSTYDFQGLTSDGRFLVRFRASLASTESDPHSLDAVTGLDEMLRSLAIEPLAFTSSVPGNRVDCLDDLTIVADISLPDKDLVERGELFTKAWRVRNSGDCFWLPDYTVIGVTADSKLQWQNVTWPAVVAPGEETTITIRLRSPDESGNYQAMWQLADEHGSRFGPSLPLQIETPPPASAISGHGAIEGQVHYPAAGMPALTIYFLLTDQSERYALQTESGWTHYRNELPAGEYYVFARVTGDESASGGGYTASVLCGMNAACTDHSLVPVTIKEGRATRQINIVDWYAPAGTFPLP